MLYSNVLRMRTCWKNKYNPPFWNPAYAPDLLILYNKVKFVSSYMVHTELQHLHSEDSDSMDMCRHIEIGSAQNQYMILQKSVLVLTHDQI